MKHILVALIGLYLCSTVLLFVWTPSMDSSVLIHNALNATEADLITITSYLRDVKNNNAGDSSQRRNASSKEERKNPPYAYSFVIGGCDPDYPNYRSYLYGIFVSSYLLRELGSESDIYLFVEMHHKSKHKKLPKKEMRVLRGLKVNVVMVPSMTNPSFYQLQLQKFRILGLTQYRRVFHLDSDFMPLCNLDYLFHYSDEESDVWKKAGYNEPVLQENFVIASPNDPSNGGNFILTPHPGDLELINEIIQKKERKIAQGIPWDEKMGWGADIGRWDAVLQHGYGWTFLAASGDQGLLYYWVKYVKKRVSVMAGYGRFETWTPLPNGTIHLKNVTEWPLPMHNSVHLWKEGRSGVRKDFMHFMGGGKPWEKTIPDLSRKTKMKDPKHFWQYCLKKLDKKYNMGIDFEDLAKQKAVPYQLAQQENAKGQITNLLLN